MPHRARAAFLASADRSAGVIAAYLALSPAPAAARPPRRPRATAAGFFLRCAMVGSLPQAPGSLRRYRH